MPLRVCRADLAASIFPLRRMFRPCLTLTGVRTDNVWACGPEPLPTNEYEYGPDCMTGEKMLYVWAKNASRLDLPDDVGFPLPGKKKLIFSF